MTIMENGKPDRKGKISFEPQRDDPARFSLLTEAEKLKIREKAKLTIENELKDREEAALLAQYLKEERQKTDPNQVLIPLCLSLAPHCPYIMIDGTQYFSDFVYHVTPATFQTLVEIQARGWAHEDDTEVRDTKTRRRVRPPPHIGAGNFMDNRNPRDMVVTSGMLQSSNANSLLGLRPA